MTNILSDETKQTAHDCVDDSNDYNNNNNSNSKNDDFVINRNNNNSNAQKFSTPSKPGGGLKSLHLKMSFHDKIDRKRQNISFAVKYYFSSGFGAFLIFNLRGKILRKIEQN